MQKKVIKDLTGLIETLGYEAIDIPVYGNGGHISIQNPEIVGELGSVKYSFDNCGLASRMTLSIAMKGHKILSQPPRVNYYDFYLLYTDIDGYADFRNTVEDSMKLLTYKTIS